MKGCICHFTKWQIHPFISKGAICRYIIYRYMHVYRFKHMRLVTSTPYLTRFELLAVQYEETLTLSADGCLFAAGVRTSFIIAFSKEPLCVFLCLLGEKKPSKLRRWKSIAWGPLCRKFPGFSNAFIMHTPPILYWYHAWCFGVILSYPSYLAFWRPFCNVHIT